MRVPPRLRATRVGLGPHGGCRCSPGPGHPERCARALVWCSSGGHLCARWTQIPVPRRLMGCAACRGAVPAAGLRAVAGGRVRGHARGSGRRRVLCAGRREPADHRRARRRAGHVPRQLRRVPEIPQRPGPPPSAALCRSSLCHAVLHCDLPRCAPLSCHVQRHTLGAVLCCRLHAAAGVPLLESSAEACGPFGHINGVCARRFARGCCGGRGRHVATGCRRKGQSAVPQATSQARVSTDSMSADRLEPVHTFFPFELSCSCELCELTEPRAGRHLLQS